MDDSEKKLVNIDLKSLSGNFIEGIYLYVNSSRTGTSKASPFVDILLLNGSSNAYPNGVNYYLKIGKDFIVRSFQ